MSRKPVKRLQLLRGARLALQHYKESFNAKSCADMEYLSEFHRREYRRLSFSARKAYDRWEPTSDFAERVCR